MARLQYSLGLAVFWTVTVAGVLLFQLYETWGYEDPSKYWGFVFNRGNAIICSVSAIASFAAGWIAHRFAPPGPLWRKAAVLAILVSLLVFPLAALVATLGEMTLVLLSGYSPPMAMFMILPGLIYVGVKNFGIAGICITVIWSGLFTLLYRPRLESS